MNEINDSDILTTNKYQCHNIKLLSTIFIINFLQIKRNIFFKSIAYLYNLSFITVKNIYGDIFITNHLAIPERTKF